MKKMSEQSVGCSVGGGRWWKCPYGLERESSEVVVLFVGLLSSAEWKLELERVERMVPVIQIK